MDEFDENFESEFYSLFIVCIRTVGMGTVKGRKSTEKLQLLSTFNTRYSC